MNTFMHHVAIATPLFSLVLIGYVLMRFSGWPKAMSDSLSQFVFSVALPAMLFRLMCDFSKLPPVDARLLIAFFGGCLIVFVVGRVIAWKVFALDGVSQSVFALGGVFSNNLLLGLPRHFMQNTLGDQRLKATGINYQIRLATQFAMAIVTITGQPGHVSNNRIPRFGHTIKQG